ncbi:MAG: hypothetical protein OXC18_19815 [Desulfurellaceae bacterium]|nr:hypothetical protein [Desulfurellaceae bacterium]
MSSVRNLWFDTRHLLGGPRGQALLAELDALPAPARETLLAAGDRLADSSLTLAQVFCRNAPAAWQAFGEDRFAHWVQVGEQFVRHEPTSREGAVAYFSIPPDALARLGWDQVEAWVAVGCEVLQVSRRLGAQFLQTSAPLLPDLPAPLTERLHAWARHGSTLLRKKGWKGEFLALSYFSAAPLALPVLSPAEMREWAVLGVLVQDSGPWTFYTTLPSGFAELTEKIRLQLLVDCQAAANHSPAAAEAIFAQLSAVLAGLPPALRTFLLAILAPVIRSDPEALLSLFPLMAPCLNAIESVQRPALRKALVTLAQDFAPGIPPAIRTLPRAYEEAGEQRLLEWIATGRDIGRTRPEAGVTFFALESRTSLRVLRHDDTGVNLEEVQEVLRKYIQMLSGWAAGIERQEFFSYPPALEEFPVPGDAIPLPARIDLFPTYEENFRLFRALAMLQAGRREFGTYDFRLERLWPQLSEEVRQLSEASGPPTGGLGAFFACFPHPQVVEALFLLVETRRVTHRVGQSYRGLRSDLEWLNIVSLPSLLPETLRTLFATLTLPPQPSHTVYDSARWAADTYQRILSSLVMVQRQDQDPASFEAALFEKMTGDALIDPDMTDDSPPPAEDMPELPQLTLEPEEDDDTGGAPLSPEELKALLEAGVELNIRQGKPDSLNPQGLYITDLDGKLPAHSDPDARLPENGTLVSTGRRRERQEALTFFYDEWDYHIADYRARWCRLREIMLSGDAGEFFAKTLGDYVALTPAIKAEFQRIRPEQYRLVRGLEDGEEFDLNAVITAVSDRRARLAPSPKVYTTKRQTERDVAALFLLDMSASTDEPVVPLPPTYGQDDPDDWLAAWKKKPVEPQPKPRRIIDVTKEALVLMAEALEEIGDAYAVYGFSGQGRDNVEFYHVKSFTESLSPTIKGRIGAIEPKRSTRMGPAIRHSLEKLKDIACRVKLLILLSDGFPQDMDYGTDRRSATYGIQDTMMALREADQAGVLTFCLTIDKAGHDYLRDMCAPSRYMVLEDVTSLPTELPKVYQRYIRPWQT